jgi:hypothetical protein
MIIIMSALILLSGLGSAAPDFRSKFDTVKATSWDFEKNGGLYPLTEARQAKAFFEEHGFVVINGLMSEHENEAVKQALVDDLHEINPSTGDVVDLAGFDEYDLPTSPNHSFRTTCNLCFGRFASVIRSHEGVRAAFAALHDCTAEELGCSWDTIFYTSKAIEVKPTDATQLHWDHNGYCGGERHPLSEKLCVQGVYYASATDEGTPAFACSPGSNRIWRDYSESDSNPAKQGSRLLNYMPLDAFDDSFLMESGLAPPKRIHCPAGSLVLWDARTCHGNTPPATSTHQPSAAGGGIGRVSLAICYHPVRQRTPAVQKDSLLKALGGVRTTHHPVIMLSHNKQGYPSDWTAEAEHEPNPRVSSLRIPLNPEVTGADFDEMLARAELPDEARARLGELGIALDNVQRLVYDSYWERNGLVETDVYAPLAQLRMSDLRRLVHPMYSRVQGVHPAEMQMDP